MDKDTHNSQSEYYYENNVSTLKDSLSQTSNGLAQFLKKHSLSEDDYGYMQFFFTPLESKSESEIEATIKSSSVGNSHFIHMVCISCNTQVVRTCLDIGMSIHSCDDYGYNCLFYAIMNGVTSSNCVCFIKYLLDCGADYRKVDTYGKSHLDLLFGSKRFSQEKKEEIINYINRVEINFKIQ